MERNTRQREAVRQAVEQSGHALTPAEILRAAQVAVPGLNLSTIYRQLNGLLDESRIVKVLLPGEPARFEAACHQADAHFGPHHHHHFHCAGCDRVMTLHRCPGAMQDLVPAGFVVQAHEITLRGLCVDCDRQGLPGLSGGTQP